MERERENDLRHVLIEFFFLLIEITAEAFFLRERFDDISQIDSNLRNTLMNNKTNVKNLSEVSVDVAKTSDEQLTEIDTRHRIELIDSRWAKNMKECLHVRRRQESNVEGEKRIEFRQETRMTGQGKKERTDDQCPNNRLLRRRVINETKDQTTVTSPR